MSRRGLGEIDCRRIESLVSGLFQVLEKRPNRNDMGVYGRNAQVLIVERDSEIPDVLPREILDHRWMTEAEDALAFAQLAPIYARIEVECFRGGPIVIHFFLGEPRHHVTGESKQVKRVLFRGFGARISFETEVGEEFVDGRNQLHASILSEPP